MKNHGIACVALSAALAAISVLAFVLTALFLPDAVDFEASGIFEAFAGGLAIAVALAAVIAITLAACAVCFAFSAASFAVCVRALREKPCGKKTEIVLWISLAGTAAALFCGILLAFSGFHPAVVAAGAAMLVCGAAECVLRVIYAVQLRRSRLSRGGGGKET